MARAHLAPSPPGFLARLGRATCSIRLSTKLLKTVRRNVTTPPLTHSQYPFLLSRPYQQLEPVLAALTHSAPRTPTPPAAPSQQPTMRAASILALGCYAAVSSAKDILDDIEDSAQEASSSVASAVESVTSSAVEKPTFTVSPAIESSNMGALPLPPSPC